MTIGQTWDVNYGADGAAGGGNIAFTVGRGQTVTFTYDPTTHVLRIATSGGTPVHSADNNVEYAGLAHDSRDPLYRTPQGAVPASTPVTLRFRT